VELKTYGGTSCFQQPGHQTEYFDLNGKRKRAVTEGVKAWIDPEGYRRFIASKRRDFEGGVDLEMGARKDARNEFQSSRLGINMTVQIEKTS
jgi:hypothetical protein